MKKLKNLKLHILGQAEMTKKEMNALTGGYNNYSLPNIYICGCVCPTTSCGCQYAEYQKGTNDAYYVASSTDAYFAAYQSSLNSSNTSSTSGDYGA